MTVLLTLTLVAFLLAAVGGTTRMLDDADVARRDALSLSVLAAESTFEGDCVYVPESWTR